MYSFCSSCRHLNLQSTCDRFGHRNRIALESKIPENVREPSQQYGTSPLCRLLPCPPHQHPSHKLTALLGKVTKGREQRSVCGTPSATEQQQPSLLQKQPQNKTKQNKKTQNKTKNKLFRRIPSFLTFMKKQTSGIARSYSVKMKAEQGRHFTTACLRMSNRHFHS